MQTRHHDHVSASLKLKNELSTAETEWGLQRLVGWWIQSERKRCAHTPLQDAFLTKHDPERKIYCKSEHPRAILLHNTAWDRSNHSTSAHPPLQDAFLRNTIPKERSIVNVSTQEPSCSTTPRGTEATTVQVRTHHYKTPFLRNTIQKERSIVKVSTQEPSCSTTPRGTEATTAQDTASKRLKWMKEDSTTVKKYFQNYICGTRIGYPGKKTYWVSWANTICHIRGSRLKSRSWTTSDYMQLNRTWKVGGKSAGSAIGSAPMCVFACVTIACARSATTQTELRAMIMMQKPTLQPRVRLPLLMSTYETTLNVRVSLWTNSSTLWHTSWIWWHQTRLCNCVLRFMMKWRSTVPRRYCMISALIAITARIAWSNDRVAPERSRWAWRTLCNCLHENMTQSLWVLWRRIWGSYIRSVITTWTCSRY